MDEEKMQAPELNRPDETPPDDPKPTPARDTVFGKGTVEVIDENGEILFQQAIVNCRLYRTTSRYTDFNGQLVWNLYIPIVVTEEPTAEQLP
jgi:hypothetical protein